MIEHSAAKVRIPRPSLELAAEPGTPNAELVRQLTGV